jgi:hypothetical protein
VSLDAKSRITTDFSKHGGEEIETRWRNELEVEIQITVTGEIQNSDYKHTPESLTWSLFDTRQHLQLGLVGHPSSSHTCSSRAPFVDVTAVTGCPLTDLMVEV